MNRGTPGKILYFCLLIKVHILNFSQCICSKLNSSTHYCYIVKCCFLQNLKNFDSFFINYFRNCLFPLCGAVVSGHQRVSLLLHISTLTKQRRPLWFQWISLVICDQLVSLYKCRSCHWLKLCVSHINSVYMDLNVCVFY